ncbi:hypothetical protein [Vibrio cholerae]|uniref:hypothetical protein n=1 Tax=Vibrio cholerae TaxID=666 RepID=UPI0011D4613B|nr:hypothetical protein [Vibrio cholerae]EGR2537673.1 hypothetical protein [Vibrio cholerae]TXZ65737.1 hypothetical protein FXE41_03065 [Vibrio cholerae]BCN20534.1 hypothetical protein [Vibrio cholerae]
MKIFYLGKSGKLNSALSKALSDRECDVTRESARINMTGIKCDVIIFGGRYFNGIIPSNVRFIYLSTLIPNCFRDKYQELKYMDDKDVQENGGKVINIPFIDELMPPCALNIITTRVSDFFIYKTSIPDIVDAILYDKDLYIEKCYVDLSFTDKVFWMFFSSLYKLTDKIKPIKIPLLVYVKVLEKFLMSLFGHAKLSCVYIVRED